MKHLLIICFTLVLFNSFAQKTVWVNGYSRIDGTFVDGHYRTLKDHTVNNNWTTTGNVNPFTGKPGYLPRDFDKIYFNQSFNLSISVKAEYTKVIEKNYQNLIDYIPQMNAPPKLISPIKMVIESKYLEYKNIEYSRVSGVTYNDLIKSHYSESLNEILDVYIKYCEANDIIGLRNKKGGYHISQVTKYKIGNEQKILSLDKNPNFQIYYDGWTVFFKNGSYNWQFRELEFLSFNQNLGCYQYVSKGDTILIEKNFKYLTIMSPDNGGANCVELFIGTADSNIKHD